jgi:hypothetical protein
MFYGMTITTQHGAFPHLGDHLVKIDLDLSCDERADIEFLIFIVMVEMEGRDVRMPAPFASGNAFYIQELLFHNQETIILRSVVKMLYVMTVFAKQFAFLDLLFCIRVLPCSQKDIYIYLFLPFMVEVKYKYVADRALLTFSAKRS